MQPVKQLFQNNPLGRQLVAAILIYSSLITLFATGFQLWSDYRYERSAIDERIRQIESSSLKSLTNSLWEINPDQVQVQLDGLLQLPDVQYLEVISPYGEAYFAGQKPETGQLLTRNYPLNYQTVEGQNFNVGHLTLIISLEQIYQRLTDKVLLILTSQGIKTFLVSAFILTLFHQLITRHLGTMAHYARRLKLDRLETPLQLKRHRQKQDELADVVSAINSMRTSMLQDIEKRRQAEQQLERLNSELEQRVAERTRELENRNTELQSALQQLQDTQQQLVESEKMAALGELVAGVAHEINTPIGIGFTAATYLQDQARALADSPATDQDSERQKLLDLTLESSNLISTNLEKAAQLVRAFKQVSVDQSSEQQRVFDLVSYLQEILLSLKPRLKFSQPDVEIRGPDSLCINSYPGSYYQIFNNLILNSVIHGFDNRPGGQIRITLHTDAAQQQLQIDYCDNGKGIPDGWHQKLFAPFVTNRRHEDCSGLGMHITYNLVTQLLGGQIVSLPPEDHDRGARFRLTLPMTPPQRPPGPEDGIQ